MTTILTIVLWVTLGMNLGATCFQLYLARRCRHAYRAWRERHAQCERMQEHYRAFCEREGIKLNFDDALGSDDETRTKH